ncbi:MAG: hypothetical protein C4348_02350 [Patescibacteria group bacterium]
MRVYWLYKPKDNNLIGEPLQPKHALLTSIWRFPPEKNNPHPAPFPLVLPLRCIYSVMDGKKSGIVLDPYCGSGTTLVAAKILGYDFIGIDISEEYLKMAQERLKNYEQEIQYAQEELVKHVVEKMFKERKESGVYKKTILNILKGCVIIRLVPYQTT